MATTPAGAALLSDAISRIVPSPTADVPGLPLGELASGELASGELASGANEESSNGSPQSASSIPLRLGEVRDALLELAGSSLASPTQSYLLHEALRRLGASSGDRQVVQEALSALSGDLSAPVAAVNPVGVEWAMTALLEVWSGNEQLEGFSAILDSAFAEGSYDAWRARSKLHEGDVAGAVSIVAMALTQQDAVDAAALSTIALGHTVTNADSFTGDVPMSSSLAPVSSFLSALGHTRDNTAAVTSQSVALTGLGQHLRGTLQALQLTAAGLRPPLMTAYAAYAAHEEAYAANEEGTPPATISEVSVARRLQTASASAHMEGLCSSVASALMALEGSQPLSMRLRSAIASRRFNVAAELIRDSDRCLTADTCAAVIEVVKAGCPIEATPATGHWDVTAAPSWRSATVQATGAKFEAGGLQLVDDALVGTLTFDVKVRLRARVFCPGSSLARAVNISIGQSGVELKLFSTPAWCTANSCDGATSDASATAIASSIRLHDDGHLSLDAAGSSRWWEDYETLVVSPSHVAQLRLDTSAVCAAMATTPLPQASSPPVSSPPLEAVEIQTAVDEPLVTTAPITGVELLSLGLNRELGATTIARMHRAPLLICESTCALPGFVPSAIAGASRVAAAQSSDLDLRLGAQLSRCYYRHRQAYATCGTRKADADAEFASCASATMSDGQILGSLQAWWFLQLRYLPSGPLPEPDLARFGAALDCDTFSAAQQANCRCELAPVSVTALASSVAADVHNSLARVRGLSAGGASFACLAGSVGDRSDLAIPITNHSGHDRRVVATRLAALGYLDANAANKRPELLANAIRVFACATAGERGDFEARCDIESVGTCRVEGAPCEHPSEHGTCLFPLACADGRVVPAGRVHSWLRAVEAPRWLELAAAGLGFEVVPSPGAGSGERAITFGTTWLRDAIGRAGSRYDDMQAIADPESSYESRRKLHIFQAASRFGGAPAKAGHQTGLQISLLLPTRTGLATVDNTTVNATVVDELALEAQQAVLRGAGLEVRRIPASETVPSHLRAHVSPPEIALVRRVPYITAATLTASRLLTITGMDLGQSAADVVSVGFGDVSCSLVAHTPSSVEASCASDVQPSGLPWLITASGGEGVGCQLSAWEGEGFSVDTRPPTVRAGVESPAIAQIGVAVAQPAAALGVRTHELQRRLQGLMNAWSAMTSAPAGSNNSHLVYDVLPGALESLDGVIARDPATLTLVPMAAAVGTSLDAMSPQASSKLLDDTCSWARTASGSAYAAIERLPHVRRSASVTAELDEKLLALKASLAQVKTELDGAKSLGATAMANASLIVAAIAPLNFDALVDASRVINTLIDTGVDFSAQSAAVQAMVAFMNASLPSRLASIGERLQWLSSGVEALKSNLSDVEGYVDIDHHDSPINLLSRFTSSLEAEMYKFLPEPSYFLDKLKEADLLGDKAFAQENLAHRGHIKRFLRYATSAMDLVRQLPVLQTRIKEAVETTMLREQSLVDLHTAFSALTDPDLVREGTRAGAALESLASELSSLQATLAPVERMSELLSVLSRSAELFANDVYQDTFPADAAQLALDQMTVYADSGLGLLASLERISGGELGLLDYLQQATTLHTICNVARQVPPTLESAAPVVSVAVEADVAETLRLLGELRSELGRMLTAEARIADPNYAAGVLISLRRATSKLSTLNGHIDVWAALDVRAAELVITTAATVTAVESHTFNFVAADAWSRYVWQSSFGEQGLLGAQLAQVKCQELSLRAHTPSPPEWVATAGVDCSLISSTSTISSRWAFLAPDMANTAAAHLASVGAEAAASIAALRTSITSDLAVVEEDALTRSYGAIELMREASVIADVFGTVSEASQLAAHSLAVAHRLRPEIEVVLMIASVIASAVGGLREDARGEDVPESLSHRSGYSVPLWLQDLRNEVTNVVTPADYPAEVAMGGCQAGGLNEGVEHYDGRPRGLWWRATAGVTFTAAELEAGVESVDNMYDTYSYEPMDYSKNYNASAIYLFDRAQSNYERAMSDLYGQRARVISQASLVGYSQHLCLLHQTFVSLKEWMPDMEASLQKYLDKMMRGVAGGNHAKGALRPRSEDPGTYAKDARYDDAEVRGGVPDKPCTEPCMSNNVFDPLPNLMFEWIQVVDPAECVPSDNIDPCRCNAERHCSGSWPPMARGRNLEEKQLVSCDTCQATDGVAYFDFGRWLSVRGDPLKAAEATARMVGSVDGFNVSLPTDFCDGYCGDGYCNDDFCKDFVVEVDDYVPTRWRGVYWQPLFNGAYLRELHTLQGGLGVKGSESHPKGSSWFFQEHTNRTRIKRYLSREWLDGPCPYCIADTVQLAPPAWYGKEMPSKYLAFWSMTTKPLVDCRQD